MKFETIEDLEIPQAAAFEMLSDFSFFERMAMRRGAEVTRRNGDGADGLGSAWDLNVPWRGKTVKMQVDVSRFEKPEALGFQADAPAIEVQLDIELVALSNHKTRLLMKTDISAKTLTGRLLLQSMKLTRGKIEKRMASRISEQSRNLEKRYRETQAA
ncbi:SRPBCC family protein [Cognatishimia sp. D5M38]|uniref:SRPBCC family protein n=2 Tax=Cognatishimia TaxID=2211635 RepID=A0A975EQY0_9RHOB|nr:SRPBCC family protein [Cognatishimia activa]QTN36713.1 SRPBCC family protein [Cognatishimia activa]